jgi:cytochrome c oxidase cbb3-type subunit 3
MGQDNSKNTTGHVWDDDLQELTNPLPQWWLWTFYLTIVFSIVYWVMYPAWPIGKTYTTGVPGVNTIQYTNSKGEAKTTHWNMRAKLMVEMNEGAAAQKKWFDKVAATPYEEVAKDAELMQFVQSAGKTLFADNCAACHQAGGQGKIGLAPNLVDDSWMFGGTYENVHETISNGRNGMMPAFGASLSDEKLTQVANYVLSLSGEEHDAAAATAGDAIFHGEGTCLACHGPDGKGMQAMGSANLIDKIWLWADVANAGSAEAKVAAVKKIVSEGMSRGKMPAWSGRLKPEQVKLLTVYVHDSLGGGK